jgi:hypothetical protein
VGFFDIDNKESGSITVPVIESIQSGNLPPERWSGVASENEDDRPIPLERGEPDDVFPGVLLRKYKVRGHIAGLQIPAAGHEPELFEGKQDEDHRVFDLRHDLAESGRRLIHGGEKPDTDEGVENDYDNKDLDGRFHKDPFFIHELH